MKKMHFLSGLPRSGGTLLSALLNQHPDIYSSPLSPLVDVMSSVRNTFDTSEAGLRNYNPDVVARVVASLPTSFYSHIKKPIIIDREKNWSFPANFEIITEYIDKEPKIIFTTRNLLEILASWTLVFRKDPFKDSEILDAGPLPLWYNSIEDARCDWIMRHSIMQRSLEALKHALKEENQKFFHFVDYSELVFNPKKTMTDLYSFLEVDYYENDFLNVKKLEKDNELAVGHPEFFHEVRPVVERTSPSYDQVLSPYIIDSYKNDSFWEKDLRVNNV